MLQKIEQLKEHMTFWRTWMTKYKTRFETKLRTQNEILDRLTTGRAWIGRSTPAVDIYNDGVKLGKPPPPM